MRLERVWIRDEVRVEGGEESGGGSRSLGLVSRPALYDIGEGAQTGEGEKLGSYHWNQVKDDGGMVDVPLLYLSECIIV